MGAQDFSHRIEKNGRTARQCFDELTDQARHEYGHGGYSGTIAEKTSFRMVTTPPGQTPRDYMNALINSFDDEKTVPGWNPYEDKWGDAGCIDDGDAFVFFGSASS